MMRPVANLGTGTVTRGCEGDDITAEKGEKVWLSPCLSGSADCDTRAETAGKVMEDMAATAPAAHIILFT